MTNDKTTQVGARTQSDLMEEMRAEQFAEYERVQAERAAEYDAAQLADYEAETVSGDQNAGRIVECKTFIELASGMLKGHMKDFDRAQLVADRKDARAGTRQAGGPLKMAAPKFTAGEWNYSRKGPGVFAVKTGKAIAVVKASCDHNAALIAAAPDLYSALEECRAALLDPTQDPAAAAQVARLALAKARGE